MKHEKTFEAIAKLKDVEVELHRLKNALEMANKALDAKREWQGLTDNERIELAVKTGGMSADWLFFMEAVEKKLKEKNEERI